MPRKKALTGLQQVKLFEKKLKELHNMACDLVEHRAVTFISLHIVACTTQNTMERIAGSEEFPSPDVHCVYNLLKEEGVVVTEGQYEGWADE